MIHNPYRTDIKDPYLVRHLRDQFRIIMGLWEFPRVSVTEKAEISGLAVNEYMLVSRQLFNLGISPAKFVRRFGLPLSATVDIPKQVYCHRCSASVSSLPCVTCCRNDGRPDDQPPDVYQESSQPLRQPDQVTDSIEVGLEDEPNWDVDILDNMSPTAAMPGTQEKFMVLVYRAHNNLPLWHPRDRTRRDGSED